MGREGTMKGNMVRTGERKEIGDSASKEVQ